MSVVVAEGVVEITADAKKVPGQIAKDIEAGGNKAGAAGTGLGKKIFGGVLAGWAAIGGVTAITGFFTGAVSGASDLNETLSKGTAIFGDHMVAIESFGNNAAKNVGMSKSAAIAAAAAFGDMFSQIGFTTDAAAAMSQQVVVAAADLGSFSNLETADVADRISAAFRGEYDSLQAVIPNINAARVESEALAATGKKVASELTAQEKATAVMAIVTKDGARAMGDFERTSDGAANSAKIVTAQFSDQQTKLGTLLLPAWTGFLGFLGTVAIPAFITVTQWISKNGETLGLLAAVVGIAAVAYFGITTAMGIHAAFSAASAAATTGLTFAQWALNAALTANPIGIIVTLLALLVGAIVWVATQTTFFQDAWAVMTEIIGTAWQWLWDTVLNPVFTAIGAVFTWLYDTIIMPIVTGIMIYVGLWAAIFTWLWDTVLNPVFTAIGAIFNWLWANVISPIVDYIKLAITGMGIVFTWLNTNIIQPVFAALGAAFNWIWANVISPVANFISSAITNVGNTIRGVFGGISSFIGNAFQSVLGVVRGPLNALIGLINGVIGGLNSIRVTIPSWVPIVGGNTFGLSIPRIPMLARGTNNAPDMFIAGDAGPELITGARGATVRPYSATQDLLAGKSGGGDIYIDRVILDAKNVREFNDVVDMVKALPQVSRSGRGSNVKVGS